MQNNHSFITELNCQSAEYFTSHLVSRMSFSSPVRRTTSSSSRPSEETGWNTLVSGTSSHVVPRRSLRHRKTNQDSPITASNLRSIVGPQSSQTSTQNSTSTVMDTDWNQVGLGPSTSDDSPDLFESSLSAADAKPGHPFRLRPRSPTTQPGTGQLLTHWSLYSRMASVRPSEKQKNALRRMSCMKIMTTYRLRHGGSS